jgi:anti-anti-sigma factor
MELSLEPLPDGVVIARTSGPLDDSAWPPFQQQLMPIVRQYNGRLVIDVSGSEKITSSGLSVLVKLVAEAHTHRSRVAVAAPPAFVRSVLKVTKLDTYIDVLDTLQAAVQHVTAGPQGPA